MKRALIVVIFLRLRLSSAPGYFAAAGVQAKESTSANEIVRFGCIGVDGKGDGDTQTAGRLGQVVACCDVDNIKLNKALKKFKGAAGFNDFRDLLDKMGSEIDAVTVSTPDHMHAPSALKAMRMGKHCFCQKPLTRTIHEARLMGQIREKTS